MALKNNIENTIPPKPENPFKVPAGYFENLQGRVLDNIKKEDSIPNISNSRKIYLRPYLALAASVSGLALIVYIILQSIIGTQIGDNGFYDLALLDKTGISMDESVVAETFNNEEENPYTDWEEEAMTYLASNEVDLIHLLELN